MQAVSAGATLLRERERGREREGESDLLSRGIRWVLPVLGSSVIRACSCSNALAYLVASPMLAQRFPWPEMPLGLSTQVHCDCPSTVLDCCCHCKPIYGNYVMRRRFVLLESFFVSNLLRRLVCVILPSISDAICGCLFRATDSRITTHSDAR